MALRDTIPFSGQDWEPEAVDAAGNPKYYLFVKSNGRWKLQKQTMDANGIDSTFRYAQGGAVMDHVTAWDNRASLNYYYLEDAF